ncbi:MAG: PorV/PorQ family protein [Bacteroidia bacterium]
MKNIKNILAVAVLSGATAVTFAGNETRSGQAGATELLINPWARSSGFGNANASLIKGLESQFLNVAGLAHVKKTELILTRTNYLMGSGITFNSIGFAQHVGEAGVIGVSINSMSFGKIEVTNVDNPEGGVGYYSPSLTRINLSYAKTFSNNIYGGVNIKIINEGIANLNASGVAVDAGVQYQTNLKKGGPTNMHFGISLQNVGPTLKFSGDGVSFRGYAPQNGYVPPKGNSQTTLTVEQRVNEFEMPTLLNISAAYDIALAEQHRLSPSINFISNSFTKDQFCAGAEYAYKNMFMIRTGYIAEKKSDTYINIFRGFNAGASVEFPLGKKGTTLALDYAFRDTRAYKGVHSVGLRLNL